MSDFAQSTNGQNVLFKNFISIFLMHFDILYKDGLIKLQANPSINGARQTVVPGKEAAAGLTLI